MLEHVIAYITTVVVFLALDVIWLSRVAKSFYFTRLGHLLRERPHLGVAAAFYALYVVGIVIFAVAPALRAGSADVALLYGALFGFFAYATYDITNYATLRDWPIAVTLVDIVWGAVLTGASAYLGTVGAQLVVDYL